MENPIKMDDLGGPPLFLETPICQFEDQSVCPASTAPIQAVLVQGATSYWLYEMIANFTEEWCSLAPDSLDLSAMLLCSNCLT